MSSAAPVPGKCNAKTRDGGYCASDPVTGAKRCRMHSGTATGEHKITHGLTSSRLRARYADEATRARLEELMEDPHLLDARRAVAVSQVALEDMPYAPLWEDGERLARRFLKLGADEEVPDEAVETALHALRGEFSERVVGNANAHARTVAVAAKQQKVAEIILRGALPIMRRFAERVSGLVGKYLPPIKQAEFLLDLRRIVEETQLDLVRLGEESDANGKA